MRVLVTGSSGLIGSEAVVHYDRLGADVHGLDNNMRAVFFGPAGDTRPNLQRLVASCRRFTHHELDVRDRAGLEALFERHRFDLVVHCAAQPSHDKAREIPLVDFDINAGGTINLLEATRRWCPEATFVLLSTNKVYGDAPNRLPLVELETRWEYARPEDRPGIAETCPIDGSLHSLFGASKVAADVITQEYARTFGMKTGVFRAGCLTGPHHAGVQLHGFLSYLVRTALSGEVYTVFGYRGKQVRDQIHSADVVAAVEAFASAPRPGAVYNLGGGRENSASILECFAILERRLGRAVPHVVVDAPRLGDHICYISDLSRFKRDYPAWRLTRSLEETVDEILAAYQHAT